MPGSSQTTQPIGAAPGADNDTIVAISTPPGRGGIGIVRLSGPLSRSISSALLQLHAPLVPAQVRFTGVIDPDSPSPETARIDDALVTYFAAPHSYTGEDVVEIAAHGSPVILDLLVRSALARGARLARPGEFTERAFLRGRIDLTQAEAVRDLIDSQTLYQARVAAQQLGGALSRRIQPIKLKLVELIAILEAGIDFAEDDIDVISGSEILNRIEAIQLPLVSVAATFAHGRIVHSGLTLAIVGRPNVGKSSLFNRLVQRERAIVTATPGTTRDLVTERVSLGGIPLELVDTAGLREASDEAESIGIHKSREALADADIVLVVIDASEPLADQDAQLLATLSERKALVACNKSDLVGAGNTVCDLDAFAPIATLRTSALTGEGIAELRDAILDRVREPGAAAETGMLTNLRQHQAVAGALDALTAAENAVELKTPHEMLLLDLYGALRQLDTLTGDTSPDDVLNLIFSTFCIGK